MHRLLARPVHRLRRFPWRRLLAIPALGAGVFAQIGFAASFELGSGPSAGAWKLGYGVAAACCFFLAGKLAARRPVKLTLS
ncbi:MAG: hypothetical protein H8E31_04445 [Planctomycetes bacterium]|nr:hypothetical protein [Planctomycetota bacterium]